MSTNALPAVSVDDTVPMRLNVAVAPLARLMPVHSNWSFRKVDEARPTDGADREQAVNPPLSVSATVALVAGEGPLLVSVIV